MESMNRWKLTDEIKEKNKPVIQKFLNKMEKVRSDEIENMDNNEFCIDLSDTGLSPYTLLELMKEFGYGNESFEDNGWELDFCISISKNASYPSTYEELCIHGCGMTFELKLSVSQFM